MSERLKVAWIYHTGDVSDGKTCPQRSAFETTPLVVDGVMYLTTPFSRLIALDPETGKEIWAFDPKIDQRPAFQSLHQSRRRLLDRRQDRSACFSARSTGGYLRSTRPAANP